MPFTAKEKQIKRDMMKRYGKEKGESVFYASATTGKLGKDIQARHGQAKRQKNFSA